LEAKKRSKGRFEALYLRIPVIDSDLSRSDPVFPFPPLPQTGFCHRAKAEEILEGPWEDLWLRRKAEAWRRTL